MGKWRERMKNLCGLSRKIIKTGAVVAVFLLLLALLLLLGADQFHDKANLLASAGVSVFCFGVMAGLVVDMRL
mgnify:CR=1 FL=1